MAAFSLKTASAVALLAFASGPQLFAGDDSIQWGGFVNGLKVGVSLEPAERTVVHPGEVLNLVVQFDVQRMIRVPMAALWQYSQIHVVGPTGEEYIWDPGGHKNDDNLIDTHDWTKWNPADQKPHQTELRLAEGKHIWTETETNRTAMFSLRDAGKYRAWVECKIVAGKKPPKYAWQGIAKSGEVTWTTSELPVGDRQMELTERQQLQINAWLALLKVKDRETAPGEPIASDLRKEILLAKNEGLAQKFVELATRGETDAPLILLARTGNLHDGQAGIDGPYLKSLTECLLDTEERRASAKPGPERAASSPPIDPVFLYLRFHPDDQAIRQRVSTAMKRLYRSTSAEKESAFSVVNSRWSMGPFALAALVELGDLKVGMTREQAEEMLGPAMQESGRGFATRGVGGGGGGWKQAKQNSAEENPQTLEWHSAMLPGCVNPLVTTLEAHLKDGKKIDSWQIHWPGGFRGKTPDGMPGVEKEGE